LPRERAAKFAGADDDDGLHNGILFPALARVATPRGAPGEEGQDDIVTNQVCIVTGGTRGIGFAIAEALLARGNSVGITGTTSTNVERAAARLASLAGATDRVLPLVCDVRDAGAVDSAFSSTAERFGGIDVLINNAGVGVGAPIAELSHEEWNRILGINLTGVFHCCKAAIPHLRRRSGGWIISISSLASQNPFAGAAAYAASKAALNAFSEALMQELRHENIRVSCILPGSVATEFSGRSSASGGDWRLRPQDVAQVVVDLLAHAGRSLPSRVEIRPSRPQKS
jgi:NAD(P)-dependent dehydrogenase (short-subunit alcohol dehydrogenase family)